MADSLIGGTRRKLLTRVIASIALVGAYFMGALAVTGLVMGAFATTAEARGGGRGVGRGGVGRGGWGRGGWGRGGWGRRGWGGYGGYYGNACWRWTPAGWVWVCY